MLNKNNKADKTFGHGRYSTEQALFKKQEYLSVLAAKLKGSKLVLFAAYRLYCAGVLLQADCSTGPALESAAGIL